MRKNFLFVATMLFSMALLSGCNFSSGVNINNNDSQENKEATEEEKSEVEKAIEASDFPWYFPEEAKNEGLAEGQTVLSIHGDKHVKRTAFLALVETTANPSSRDIHLALGLFVRPYLVFHRLLGSDWTLKLHGRVHDLALIRRKKAVKLRKNGLHVHVAVEKDAGVGRMVESVVEGLVHRERERRYRSGVATGHKAIRSVGVEQSGDLGVKQPLGI